MMNDFIVKVEKSTRMVDLPKNVIGNDMENLQEKLIFKFTDEFVNGQARLEYQIGRTRDYIVLSKENDTYIIPLKNVLTKEGKIEMQLVITETSETEEIPVFKSNVFYLYCNKSINAVNEAPAGYELWIETANAKLNLMDEALTEVDNLDVDANKVGKITTVEITRKDGTTKSVEILDGERGPQGEQGIQGVKGDNATINGVNTLNIVAGTNINLSQSGSTLTISTDADENVQSDWNQADSTKDDYIKNKPTKLSDFTDDLGSSPTHTHIQYLTEHQDISMKQNIEDNTLNTNNKTVPSAINEVNSIAKGANQALSYSNYQAMITVFNSLANNVYNVGQNVMIITLEVPDLWISGIESTSQSYTYTTDEAFTTELATNGYVQVGYYRVSALETQKVDLTNYVQFNNYASDSNGGVIKTSGYWGTLTGSTGHLLASIIPYSSYPSKEDNVFISKGTLENVLIGKGFITSHQDITGKEDKSNKVALISSSSTNTQYPSALAVYNYIQSLNGDEVSY